MNEIWNSRNFYNNEFSGRGGLQRFYRYLLTLPEEKREVVCPSFPFYLFVGGVDCFIESKEKFMSFLSELYDGFV